MSSVRPPEPEASSSRYEILRILGQGSAGVVYLARDRDSGEQIALKKLLRVDQKSVLRLKREFRTMADLQHRNLVKLYDLGCEVDTWFITMEYVAGSDLLRFAGHDPDTVMPRDITATREFKIGRSERPLSSHGSALWAMHELAHGVRALHHAGILHRDLKPSNVLVAQERVVVLDFGLVHELSEGSKLMTQDGLVSGTPAYMAPEQARGEELGESADWYAFGVMLYQVISGELPIDGRNVLDLLARKSGVDARPLQSIAPQVSSPLNELCMALLERKPRDRPRGDEVLAVLERETLDMARASQRPANEITLSEPRQSAPRRLFGRQPQLQQLRAALDQVQRGAALLVHVHGASGAGKTALVENFCEELERSAPELVLRSRCYERETMPFKALDGVIDALVRKLSTLEDVAVAHLLPAELGELTQLFPAFERLPAARHLLQVSRPRGAGLQTRLRAESALRELFARLAARGPLLLWIDDLQWGDLDSASILRSWLVQLMTSPILFVFSYRSDEVATSPCLRVLLDRDAASGASSQHAPEQTLEITTLAAAEVQQLCEQRLGTLAEARPDLVERIGLESRGNPFLALQFTALVQAKLARGDRDVAALSIEQLIAQTSELVPPEASRILNALALAGRPLSSKIALRAAGVMSGGRAYLHALRGLRLIRSRDIGGLQLIEVYHDRVREGVQAALPASERQRVHERLLDVLEEDKHSDPDWMHTLALSAGRKGSALRHGLVAAERANSALAFERAAELYQTCLELGGRDAADSGELSLKLAAALARSRHGARAAEAYLEASRRARPHEVIPLMRLAATHFLRTGQFEKGDDLVRKVLAALQLSLPESDAAVLTALVWERAALGLRGLSYVRRSEAEVPAALLQKIDMFLPLSIENQAHDPLRAALIQARAMRWALQAGEPRRVARALCASATLTAVSGSARAARETEEVLDRAETIVREVGDAKIQGDILSARAVCAFLLGNPAGVLDPSNEAERVYQTDFGDASGTYYLRFTVVAVRIGALHVLGEYRRALIELQQTLQEARATHNRSALLHLSLCQTFADEANNQATHAIARLTEQRQHLPKGRFGPLHLLHMLSVMRAACSNDQYAWGQAWLDEDWPRWQRSPVRASAFLSLLALSNRARFALNRHVSERRKGDPRGLVRGELRALGRLALPLWRSGTQLRIEARLSLLAGETERAAAQLRELSALMAKAGAVVDSARERYALGFLVGGEQGASLRAEADQQMRDKGVLEPLIDLRAHYPELA